MLRLAGYNVYRMADGCDEEYYGFADTLEEAKKLVATGKRIEASMYDTAIAAGHCNGIAAPNKEYENDEVTEWFGEAGYDCAIAVRLEI